MSTIKIKINDIVALIFKKMIFRRKRMVRVLIMTEKPHEAMTLDTERLLKQSLGDAVFQKMLLIKKNNKKSTISKGVSLSSSPCLKCHPHQI